MNRLLYLSLLILFTSSLTSFSQSALPCVQLKSIEGKTIQTSDLNNDGKPFIISFFALWCKPCLRELDSIHEVYEEWQEETGMKLIAVSIDKAQDASRVLPTVNAKGWEYKVLLDPNSDFLRAMNANSVPAIFVLNGENRIVLHKNSYIEGSEEELIEKIRCLLAPHE